MPGNNNKPVRCVETGQVYPSQRVAIVDMTGRYNGYTADRFKSALRTGQTCFSYHWEPADAADLEPELPFSVANSGKSENRKTSPEVSWLLCLVTHTTG